MRQPANIARTVGWVPVFAGMTTECWANSFGVMIRGPFYREPWQFGGGRILATVCIIWLLALPTRKLRP